MFRSLMLILFILAEINAAGAPNIWPPKWAGNVNGSIEGVDIDDHTGFDYGRDSWGYWANLEIKAGIGGAILATMEMRYVIPEDYEIGAPENEQGSKVSEKPRVVVPLSEINGGRPFWVSAAECTQEFWEKVHLLKDPAFKMRLKQRNNSDITELDTAAFPIDVKSFPSQDYLTASGYPIDFSGAVNTGNWQSFADTAFTAAYDLNKSIRAIESQTFFSCKDFCDNKLKTAVVESTGANVQTRLPTEKEWEFICRAGTKTAFWCGRLLSGVDVELSGASISKSDFWAKYDENDLNLKIPSLPGGDKNAGGRHAEWHSYNNKTLKFERIDLDGIGHVFWHDWYVTIGGELIVKGGSLDASKVVANFDEHYQHRYRADRYGTHTPILMIYTEIDGNYIPTPYGNPALPNMFYKILNRNEYVRTSDCNTMNTFLYQQYTFSNEIWETPEMHPSDWYSVGGVAEPVQLEYREMVPVFSKYDALGSHDKEGSFIKDFNGSLHPIRSLYVPAAFYTPGVYIGSTFPDTDLGIKTIDVMVRAVDLSDVTGKTMTTEDYILAFKKSIAINILKKQYNPSFYTGSMKPTLIQMPSSLLDLKFSDEIEITVATPPVDNSQITYQRQVRNPWGFLNVHGNVSEWVDTSWDSLSSHLLPKAGKFYLAKGGSWKTGADICRSASRIPCDPNSAYDDVGFRFLIEAE